MSTEIIFEIQQILIAVVTTNTWPYKTGILANNSNPLFCDSPNYFGLISTLFSLQLIFHLLAFSSDLYFFTAALCWRISSLQLLSSSSLPCPRAAPCLLLASSCRLQGAPSQGNKYRKMPERRKKSNSAQQKLTPEENLLSAARNVNKN